MKKVLLFGLFVFLMACSKENKQMGLAERFFEIYSKRGEIDQMLSFYADDFQYENIGFESETDDPKFLYEKFYGWSDKAFQYESEKTVEVDEIVVGEKSIVAKGTTKNYTYNGKAVEGTRFVIWLELDESGKIVQQTDWFDYPMEEIIEAYQLKNAMQIR